MHDVHILPVILILLGAAVVIVAAFRRLNLSPVLGYLVAGAAIGPYGVAIIEDVEGTSAIAEFGVVFLLFVIGLELSFERLLAMRKHVFEFGSLQVLLTAGSIFLLLYLVGASWPVALILGGGLALSSTALVLQVVAETGERSSQVGRLSLAVLLLQDLAVVPLLVMVPLLASGSDSLWLALADTGFRAIAVVIALVVVGRIILRPVFRIIAGLGNPELFTALTLLVVLGIAWITSHLGLSLAMGAFIAGLLVAETEYRHQVEADILPYKGLLLGLFFMAVGMSLDITLMQERFLFILGACALLVLGKALIIFLLCRAFRFSLGAAIHSGLLLSQGGEFGFVLFRMAAEQQVISAELSQLLLVIITTSMAITPLLSLIGKKLALKLDSQKTRVEESTAEIVDVSDHVIILGYGRVGQTLGKLLAAENINFVAIDGNAAISSAAKQAGLPVYYGDGMRREVLHALGIDRARCIAITVNDFESAEKMLAAVRSVTSDLPVIARTSDLKQMLKLETQGANIAVSEKFEASLQLGAALLKVIGIKETEISRVTHLFRDQDYALARESQGLREAEVGKNRMPWIAMKAPVVSLMKKKKL